jgi:hypothetical protein
MFFSNMGNEQLIDFVRDHFQGISLSELRKKDKVIAEHLCSRGLIKKCTSLGILHLTRHANGFFSSMNNNNLRTYTAKRYSGKTIGEVESVNSSLVSELRKRDQIDLLVRRGVLIRELSPGYIKRMSDDELFSYVSDKFHGKLVSEVEDSASGLALALRRRNILERLVENKVLTRKIERNTYPEMSDLDFVRYVTDNHNGDTMTDICAKDKTLYREIKRRKMDDVLVSSKVLVRKLGVKPKFYRDWTNLESFLRDYISREGHFPTQNDLAEAGNYSVIAAIPKYHGGVSKVMARMGLVPRKVLKEQASDWNWVKKELGEIIESNGGEFPSGSYLFEHGRSDLVRAMQIYHKGREHCRKEMGYVSTRKPIGYWKSWNNMERELNILIERLGHFPRVDECACGMPNGIRFFGGIEAVRSKFGNPELVRTPTQSKVEDLLNDYVGAA